MAPDGEAPVCVSFCDELHAACEDAFFALDGVRGTHAPAHADACTVADAKLRSEHAGADAVPRARRRLYAAWRLGRLRCRDVHASWLCAQGGGPACSLVL